MVTSADEPTTAGSATSRPSPAERLRGLVAWWKRSRPGRSLAWYGARNGPLLCGGMAYAALFSLFAALTIGWTVFMSVLGSRTELRDAVLEQIDTWVPGLVDTGDGQGGVLSPDDLVLDSPVNVTSVVALVVLLFSAVAFMAALRTSVQAMFDIPATAQNAVVAKLRELGGFVLLGVAVLVSASLGVVVSALGSQLAELLGGSAALSFVLRVVGLAIGLAVDATVVALVVLLVGGARPRRRDLVLGSLVAAAVFGVLRYLGTSVVVGSASRNALLASFAVIVTLLLLVNFVGRVLLMVCAWMADPPTLPGPDEDEPRDDREARPELPLTDDAGTAAARHLAPRSAETRLRAGHGSGKPWSPIVRGVRRGRRPRGA